MTARNDNTIRFAAAGDILLADAPGRRRDLVGTFASVRSALVGADFTFANLECTLPGDGSRIATEPRVVARAEQIRAFASSGIQVVSLANNHMFDCFAAGFERLRDLLAQRHVAWFGAGLDLAEATEPLLLARRGQRIAMLAGVDERSGAAHVAGPGRFGVAPLEMDRLVGQVRELTGEVDHVIVSLHWGEERLMLPSPEQVAAARQLVDTGASLVLGHHPHVVQGMEIRNGTPICYSLGNFVADDVPYDNGDSIRWNRTERIGCLLTGRLTPAGTVTDMRQRPSFDDGQRVRITENPAGLRRIARCNRALARGVTLQRYRREHLRVKTLLPILRHLRPSELVRLRPRQVRNAWRQFRSAREAR